MKILLPDTKTQGLAGDGEQINPAVRLREGVKEPEEM